MSYDLLLVGDGHGGTHTSPAGWGCVAYDPIHRAITLHSGACTAGTTGFAELIPFIDALWHHDAVHRRDGHAHEVVIVSDSEVTVRCGNRQYGRHANGALWAAIDWFEGNGYSLSWYHVRRLSTIWNTLVDGIAQDAQAIASDLHRAAEFRLCTMPLPVSVPPPASWASPAAPPQPVWTPPAPPPNW